MCDTAGRDCARAVVEVAGGVSGGLRLVRRSGPDEWARATGGAAFPRRLRRGYAGDLGSAPERRLAGAGAARDGAWGSAGLARTLVDGRVMLVLAMALFHQVAQAAPGAFAGVREVPPDGAALPMGTPVASTSPRLPASFRWAPGPWRARTGGRPPAPARRPRTRWRERARTRRRSSRSSRQARSRGPAGSPA